VTAVLAPPVRSASAAPPAHPVPERAPTGPALPSRGPFLSNWPLVLALVSFGVYVAAGCFMLYSAHYEIGDALSRSADARFVLFSRDPHLAAWGFVWFPGPVVLELPFMAVLSPLNHAALAGPLSTAMCGGLTVLVLVKLFRRLGLSEPMVAGLTLTYAFNPVMIFYYANGMSEGSFYLAASVFLLGIVLWYQEGGSRSLILISMGLAASMAIREEALALVPLVSALAAFRERAWGRRAKVAALVALPGLFVFALWTFANWIIMGGPIFWYEALLAEQIPPTNAPWLPVHKTLITGILYSGSYALAFVPALFIVLPVLFLVVRSRRRQLWELATIVGAVSVFPGQVALLMAQQKGWGAPRYLASMTIFATVILGLAAREAKMARGLTLAARRGIAVGLVCLGAANGISGTINDINPKRTAVESESVAFRAAFGLSASYNVYEPPILTWLAFDRFIDPYLARNQLIIIDTETGFAGPLFSAYPRQWVIPSDRDFASIADNFSGQVQWLLQTESAITTAAKGEIDQALGSTDDGHWKEIKNFGPRIGQLYRWVPQTGDD
jgi:hypothetical protein